MEKKRKGGKEKKLCVLLAEKPSLLRAPGASPGGAWQICHPVTGDGKRCVRILRGGDLGLIPTDERDLQHSRLRQREQHRLGFCMAERTPPNTHTHTPPQTHTLVVRLPSRFPRPESMCLSHIG